MPAEALPDVDVFIATYNEEYAILERTIIGERWSQISCSTGFAWPVITLVDFQPLVRMMATVPTPCVSRFWAALTRKEYPLKVAMLAPSRRARFAACLTFSVCCSY